MEARGYPVGDSATLKLWEHLLNSGFRGFGNLATEIRVIHKI